MTNQPRSALRGDRIPGKLGWSLKASQIIGKSTVFNRLVRQTSIKTPNPVLLAL